MKKHNPTLYILGSFYSFSVNTATADQYKHKPSSFSTNQYLIETLTDGDLNTKKLTLKDSSPYVTELDKLPTAIIASTNQNKFEKAIKSEKNAKNYSNTLKLPIDDESVSVAESPLSAREQVKIPNWSVSDMQTVIYQAPNGSDGVMLVCMTLRRTMKNENLAILQCNDFYPESLQRLERIAEETDNYFDTISHDKQ
ncbi:hypothetical protein M8R19_21430 [Pseudomonas sp. R3.Fl]|uniref:hypothetical protein n=1 Tax=Pseudomonas TaxID=286 RepID=UPI000AC3EA91|nr:MULTISPECIES: hypothetical protein [Pseudomonas]MCL6691267.1 hypothetical protein [Pseudomonas sp. R3.Fl]UXJ53770.1 hypothetical protein N5P21_06060 [Pseudomonas citronellolis]